MSQIKIDPQITEKWEKLSKGKTEANWMAVEFKKANKDTALELMAQGEGGLEEISQKLKQLPDKAIFGVVKVKFYDEIAAQKGSPYVKFIYFRYLGSKVGVMTKGFLTPRLGQIDDIFPVKHLSYDIDENLTKFDQKTIANDFLRVSDNKVEASTFDFGPNQSYQAQNQKIVKNNKQPQNQFVPKNKQPEKPKEEPKPEPEPEPEPQVEEKNYDDNNNNNNEKTNEAAKNDSDNEQPDDQLQQEEQQEEQQDDNNDDNNNYNQNDNPDD